MVGAAAATAASGALTVGLPEVAHAQTTQSKSATYDGKQYNLVATAQKLTGVGLATGTISCAFTLPTGYLGVQASMYDGSGTLRASKVLYTTKASSSMSSMASSKVSTTYVQAQATGYVWRAGSSSYSSFKTGKTPFARSAPKEGGANPFPVNDLGLTYGSLYEAGEKGLPEPDLIRVQGVEGIVGYIYNQELKEVSSIASPDEAIAFMERGSASLPVYQSDGVTVVDEYEVQFR